MTKKIIKIIAIVLVAIFALILLVVLGYVIYVAAQYYRIEDNQALTTSKNKEQKVAVVPGSAFGECGEGFIRCSYAYSIDAINKAVERIEKFVSSHR